MLGSEVLTVVLSLLARVSYIAHWLFNIVCVSLLQGSERVVQHAARCVDDAMGTSLHTEGALRQATGIRLDCERRTKDEMGHPAWY